NTDKALRSLAIVKVKLTHREALRSYWTQSRGGRFLTWDLTPQSGGPISSSIEGKVVVITGASSGMGAAAARHLAAHGAAVVLGARRVEGLERSLARSQLPEGRRSPLGPTSHGRARYNGWWTEQSRRTAGSTCSSTNAGHPLSV